MPVIKVYNLDSVGVVVDTNPINNPPGALTKAQNAIADPIGNAGSIRKRPGLKALNVTAGAGSVLGGVGVPVDLGAAGPIITNPFTNDANVTLIPRYIFKFKVKKAPTFEDNSWWFFFDWLFDFPDINLPDFVDPTVDGGGGVDETVVAPDETDPLFMTDVFDVVDQLDNPVPITDEDEAAPLPSAPLLIPFNFATDYTQSGKYLSIETHLTQHVAYPSSFIGQTYPLPGLIWPSAGVRDPAAFTINSLNAGILIIMGGRPHASLDNNLYYASAGVGNNTVDRYTGRTSSKATTALTGTGAAATLVNSLLAADGTLFFTALMSGTPSSSTGVGAVFRYDPSTNFTSQLGATFAVDQIPFSLCWAYGRIWCGTVSNAASCKVYWMRPDIDTGWTLDTTFAAGESAVQDLAVFQGKIYAALLNRTLAGSGRLMTRTTLGVWSASDTGTIDTSGVHGNTRGYYELAVWPPENVGITSPAPTLYATRIGMTEDSATGDAALRKLSAGVWSTALNPSGIRLTGIFAIDSTKTIVPTLVCQSFTRYQWTTDGTSFTNSIANVTITPKVIFPTFLAAVPGSNGSVFTVPSAGT